METFRIRESIGLSCSAYLFERTIALPRDRVLSLHWLAHNQPTPISWIGSVDCEESPDALQQGVGSIACAAIRHLPRELVALRVALRHGLSDLFRKRGMLAQKFAHCDLADHEHTAISLVLLPAKFGW